MDSCKWKISCNNPHQCRMSELARTRTRPPWRPAASSITAIVDLDVPPTQYTLRKNPKVAELTIPPQQMSANDLIAAIPKRHRVPKPLPFNAAPTLENQRTGYLRTPWAPSSYGPQRTQLDAAELENPTTSVEQTLNSGLKDVKSVAVDANAKPSTGKYASQLASPPSGARSLSGSAPQSERSFAIASPQLKAAGQNVSPRVPMSLPTSPRRITGPSSDRASRASCASPACVARSLDPSPGQSPPSSAHASRRCINALNSNLAAPDDDAILQSSNARLDSRRRRRCRTSNGTRSASTTDTHNNNLPSRDTTKGGSEHSISPCSSVLRQSLDGPPASGHCSPPSPASPTSPTFSPY